MTKWENMIYEWPTAEGHGEQKVTAKLDELGEQGWELVTVYDRPGRQPILFLKRPLE